MVHKFQMRMTPFELERTIRVYLPQNYDRVEERYQVLYMHDGQNVFQDRDAVGGVSLGLEDYLARSSPEIMIVAIDGNPAKEGRTDEYCPWPSGEFSKRILGPEGSPWGGKGKEYLEFIVKELKPYIDRKYRTLPDQSSMAGISLGGLITTYAACRYPEVFSNIAVISTGFYRNQEKIVELIQSANLAPIGKFYMDCGTHETNNASINETNLASNQEVYENLKSKIGHLKFEIVENAEHKYIHFKKRMPAILSFLFS